MTRQTFKHDRRRTLTRGVNFAPCSVDDLKWIWAAYKKGSFKDGLYEELMQDGLNPSEFAEIFELTLIHYQLDCYVLSAFSENGLKPIGFVLVWKRGRLIEISNFVWFVWATKRNKLEASLGFLNQFRSTVHEGTGRKYKLIGFVEQNDRSLFDHLVKYKVLRLVGKVYDFYENAPAIVYETVSTG